MVRKVNITCPACGEEVEVVFRDIEVLVNGSNVFEGTITFSTYKHKCPNLGGS